MAHAIISRSIKAGFFLSLASSFLRLTWARLRKEAHLEENMAVALYDGTGVSHSEAWDYEEKQ